MNLSLNLDLNDELTAALTAAVSAANASLAANATPYTAETYLARLLQDSINSYVRSAYDRAVARLGAAAAALDYPTRTALIAQIEAQLAP